MAIHDGEVLVTTGAVLNTGEQLRQHRDADADLRAAGSRFLDALMDAFPAEDAVRRRISIEQEALHSQASLSFSARASAVAFSRSRWAFRAACQSASSSAVISRGSIASNVAIQRAIASGVSS